MNLIQLIYMSTLRNNDESVLPAILESAVRYNTRDNITGMLLCADGCLMQVLEGEPASVRATFERIEADPRHHDLTLLTDESVAARSFEGWRMGLRQLSSADLNAFPQYAYAFRCSPEELKRRVSPGTALEILKSFGSTSMGIS